MSNGRIYSLQYSFLESANKIRTRRFPALSDEEAEREANQIIKRIRRKSSSALISAQLFRQVFQKHLVKEEK